MDERAETAFAHIYGEGKTPKIVELFYAEVKYKNDRMSNGPLPPAMYPFIAATAEHFKESNLKPNVLNGGPGNFDDSDDFGDFGGIGDIKKQKNQKNGNKTQGK